MLESIEARKSQAPPAAAAVGGGGAALDKLAQRLRSIGLSDDPVLADMSARLRKDGVMEIEELQGMATEEMRESVKSLSLNPLQFKKLFKAVSGT
jgi:hypothetical protein